MDGLVLLKLTNNGLMAINRSLECYNDANTLGRFKVALVNRNKCPRTIEMVYILSNSRNECPR